MFFSRGSESTSHQGRVNRALAGKAKVSHAFCFAFWLAFSLAFWLALRASQLDGHMTAILSWRIARGEAGMNKIAKLTALAVSIWLGGASAAPAATINGQAALALAGVVSLYAPLPAANKKAVAALFKGDTNFPYTAKISIVAEKIVCRTGNVDVTARSCELTFKTANKTLKGRDANELYATAAMAGIPPDGAAGSNFESLSKLNCTLDPKVLKEKAGGGADCTYEAAQ
jgi:hypothetical protein